MCTTIYKQSYICLFFLCEPCCIIMFGFALFSFSDVLLIVMQVLRWRSVVSFTWSIILLPITSVAFITFSRIQLFHPIDWLAESLGDVGSSYALFCLCLLCVLLGIHCTFNVQFYTVVPSIPCSRLTAIGRLLVPNRVLHSLAHAVIGMIVFWCCSIIRKGHFQPLRIPCTSAPSQNESIVHTMCLNEHHLFHLLAGAFLGFSYSLLYFVHNMNYLPFPSIEQFKYVQFRRCLPMLIRYSSSQSFYMFWSFTLFYFFLGYIPRTWMKSVMNLQTDSGQPPLDTLRGLLDLTLIYHTWLSGTFALVNWHLVLLLFRIHAAEAHVFPVQAVFVEEADSCLPKILSSNVSPLLKYLAFQDLALLSQYSSARRKEVFSLSQPGGHPYIWNAISKECVDLLTNLTVRLVAHQEAAAGNGRVRRSSFSAETRKLSSSSGTSLIEERSDQNQTNLPPQAAIPVALKAFPLLKSSRYAGIPAASPAANRISALSLDPNSPWHGSVQSPHVMRRNVKLWSSDSHAPLNTSEVCAFSTASPKPRSADEPNPLHVWIQQKQEQLKNFLSKRVLISHLFSKRPEASSQEIFVDAQIHIWALEGMSHLVAASFTEDKMGVVQTTFSTIMHTLLTLQEAVEKHFKLPYASSKPVRSPESFVDASYKALRFELRAALKTAIYRITTRFGEHLHAVPVSVEHRKKLQQFLDFKE
uniref:Nucleoporin NDC1 n=1 Tax=Leptobrachium leishanense TaxID=445787 RepID=A0A8C5R7K9_9ANUR